MKKAETCMYNANRGHTAANPYCNWMPHVEERPPHISWFIENSMLTDEICSKCKAYKKFKEENMKFTFKKNRKKLV